MHCHRLLDITAALPKKIGTCFLAGPLITYARTQIAPKSLTRTMWTSMDNQAQYRNSALPLPPFPGQQVCLSPVSFADIRVVSRGFMWRRDRTVRCIEAVLLWCVLLVPDAGYCEVADRDRGYSLTSAELDAGHHQAADQATDSLRTPRSWTLDAFERPIATEGRVCPYAGRWTPWCDR